MAAEIPLRPSAEAGTQRGRPCRITFNLSELIFNLVIPGAGAPPTHLPRLGSTSSPGVRVVFKCLSPALHNTKLCHKACAGSKISVPTRHQRVACVSGSERRCQHCLPALLSISAWSDSPRTLARRTNHKIAFLEKENPLWKYTLLFSLSPC